MYYVRMEKKNHGCNKGELCHTTDVTIRVLPFYPVWNHSVTW